MPELGRLTDDDMAFIGIVLESFCYGKIFCSVVIVIGIINYSCSGLYSAVFVIYIQYPFIQRTRYLQEKHPYRDVFIQIALMMISW